MDVTTVGSNIYAVTPTGKIPVSYTHLDVYKRQIQKRVIPYLYSKGFTNPMNAQKILTNRKLNPFVWAFRISIVKNLPSSLM